MIKEIKQLQQLLVVKKLQKNQKKCNNLRKSLINMQLAMLQMDWVKQIYNKFIIRNYKIRKSKNRD